METHFHQELNRLRIIMLRMAGLAERALKKSVQALSERDIDLANEVIESDQEVDELELEVDKLGLRLLALDQPMARDLRFVVGCMRISVDMERIADEAVNIAERAILLSNRPPLPPSSAMEQLADTAIDMFKRVIDAFIGQNEALALKVCRMDDTADELNLSILKSLLDYMVHEVPAVERSVHTIIAARCLERAADQATNIAESVIFIVRGANIKHHCER